MSLTGHIRGVGPVRDFFASEFGHVASLRFASLDGQPAAAPVPSAVDRGPAGELPVRAVHRFSPPPVPRVAPPAGEVYPWGLAGTAFDYRVRYVLGVVHPLGSVAASGSRLLRRDCEETGRAEPGAWLEVVDAHDRLAGAAVSDRDLARLCVVLAWFEQLYRVGPGSPAWAHSPLVTTGATSLEGLLGLVEDRVVDDVAAMTQLLVGSQPELCHPRTVVANPTFARSGALGGADADLIVDGTLVEVKTTKRAQLLTDTWWQVLGYLLADTDDAHQIRRVAVYYARYGYLWSFDVEEFVGLLAGRDVDLAWARSRFAEVLAELQAVRGAGV